MGVTHLTNAIKVVKENILFKIFNTAKDDKGSLDNN